MEVITETDQFIAAQIGPLLRAYERPLHAAYLTTQQGSIAAALLSRAFFAVLTNERLVLIETRVGAFRPIHENLGVAAYERSAIAGVHVGWNQLTLKLQDGQLVSYLCAKTHKRVTSQQGFRETLQREHGTGPVAEALARRTRLTTFGGLALSVVVLVGVLYATYIGDARVEVSCKASGGKITCDLTHTGGGADAHVCWKLALGCENGKPLRHLTCGDVARKQTSEVVVQESEISGLDACGAVTSFDIVDVAVEPID